MTTADFFAVGNRAKAYLEISVFIAQFPDYTNSLVDHIVEVKLAHWDRAVRELSAEAFNRLCCRCPEYARDQLRDKVCKNALSIDLNQRHGSILTVGEGVLALSKLCPEGVRFVDWLGPDIVGLLQKLVPELSSRSAFRGMGGEMVRAALCASIAKLCAAGAPFGNAETAAVWQVRGQMSLRLD